MKSGGGAIGHKSTSHGSVHASETPARLLLHTVTSGSAVARRQCCCCSVVRRRCRAHDSGLPVVYKWREALITRIH